jgi:hypothetical protein
MVAFATLKSKILPHLEPGLHDWIIELLQPELLLAACISAPLTPLNREAQSTQKY